MHTPLPVLAMSVNQNLATIVLWALCSVSQAYAELSRSSIVQMEAAEQYPGGVATYTGKIYKNAFTHPSANMAFVRKLDFNVGNGFFKRIWVSAPASTHAADGLGPLYNARSCQRCHIKGGRGHPPSGPEGNGVSMVPHLSIPPQNEEQKRLLGEHRLNVIPEPTYGKQLQDFAIQGHMAEGRMRVEYEEFSIELADGSKVTLRKPSYSMDDLAYGPLHLQVMVSPRVASQMIGLGLLEAIDQEAILSLTDPEDKDGDGISGRPNWIWSMEHKQIVLGRFGWKAGGASINEQSQQAFSSDIGISVPMHTNGAGDCTENQPSCWSAPNGNSPQYEYLEAHSQVIDSVTFYARNLAVPARRNHDDPMVMAGKQLFHMSGCPSCHTPSHRTRYESIGPEQSDQMIWPYTDLLIHDMGYGLADDGKSLGDRNAPTASYARFSPPFQKTKEGRYVGGQFLDGRVSDLTGQAGGPPINPVEMGMQNMAAIVQRLKENPAYIVAFKRFYGESIFEDTDRAYSAIAQSIAAFEKTDFFAPFDSKCDRYLRGEYQMTEQEDLGMTLFFSQQFTNCNLCHQLKRLPASEEETFTNYEYHNIGVPVNKKVRELNSKGDEFIDHGLLENPQVDNPEQDGKFKVSTLRNVAVTGPYMQNGVFKDLRTVVLFYNKYNSRSPKRQINPETGKKEEEPEVKGTLSLKEFQTGPALDDKRIDALVAFLRTLTDKRYEHLSDHHENIED